MTSIDDKKFLRELGSRIRAQRLARKWTQQEYAEKCGLHRTFIGSVERGERNISIPNLRLLARVLRIEIAEMMA